MQAAENPQWDQENLGTEESHRIYDEIVRRIKRAEAGQTEFISFEESIRRLRECDPRG